MTARFSLFFVPLAFLLFLVCGEETTTSTVAPAGPKEGAQSALVLNHRHAPKRHRRQYSSETHENQYEIRFLPYPKVPTQSRATRGSPGVQSPSNYVEASPVESSEPQSPALMYGAPPTTSTTTPAPTTTPVPPYRPPPNGAPRDNNQAETAPGTSHKYYYPPRMPLPLTSCFFNPTGYPCCSAPLNDLMVETYTELEAKPNFSTCNINAIANMLQAKAEKRFNTSFEAVVGFDDFAQKIHFNGDLVCKIELGGKFMFTYATPSNDATMNPNGTPNKYYGGRRHRREAAVFGPQNELPPSDLSRTHSMWA